MRNKTKNLKLFFGKLLCNSPIEPFKCFISLWTCFANCFISETSLTFGGTSSAQIEQGRGYTIYDIAAQKKMN